MKIYRCVLGVLLVFFITLAVLYVTSFFDEQRSSDEGMLILHYEKIQEGIEREDEGVTEYDLC